MLLKRMASASSSVRKHLTGFVLAGGASRRMGRDKTQIQWGSGTLLTHAIERVECVAAEVFVVGAVQANNVPVNVIKDQISGVGPLAGIHTALTYSSTDWNLILGVDLPLITPEILGWLAQVPADNSEMAIVSRVHRRLQPLCGIYHRDCLTEIDRALAKRDSSIHRLLERINTRIIEEDQLIGTGFSPEMFLNVNTPEDLERARMIANTAHG